MKPTEMTKSEYKDSKKAWDEEEKKKLMEDISWSEFTQNTTFHGVKYIFQDNQRIRFRRWIWIVSVFAAISGFLAQTGDRLSAYLKYDSSINMEVVFPERLEMPAVTICNQNNFRITKASERGLYEAINKAFHHGDKKFPDYTENELSAYNDSYEVMSDLAHKKEDMIMECKWGREACNSSHFQRRVTDLGVCYTFQASRTDIKKVNEAGANNGLQLLLLLEQYEYMRGPQNDAGIKVMLHDSDEIPLMADVGLAVAPGTHSWVGFKLIKYKSLPHPHGTCNVADTPLSNCFQECWKYKAIRKYGCIAPNYKRHHTDNSSFIADGAPVCDLNSTFYQIKDDSYKAQQANDKCDCQIPCNRNVYETSISFAHLSEFNVASISERGRQGEGNVLKNVFLKALETRQRMNHRIKLQDSGLFGDLMKSLMAMKEVLPKTLIALSKPTLPKRFSEFYEPGLHILEKHLTERYIEAQQLALNLDSACSSSWYAESPLYLLMDFTASQNFKTVALLDECVLGSMSMSASSVIESWAQAIRDKKTSRGSQCNGDLNAMETILQQWNDTMNADCSGVNATVNPSCSDCQLFVTGLSVMVKNFTQYLTTDKDSSFVVYQKVFEEYEQSIAGYFINTTFNVSEISEHRQCLDEKSGTFSNISALVTSANSLSNLPAISYNQSTYLAKDFMSVLQSLPKDMDLAKLKVKCEWVPGNFRSRASLIKGLDIHEQSNKPHFNPGFKNDQQRQLMKGVTTFEDALELSGTFTNKLFPYFSKFFKYADGNVTKLDLALLSNSPNAESVARDFSRKVKDLAGKLWESINRCESVVHSTQKFVGQIISESDTKLPIRPEVYSQIGLFADPAKPYTLHDLIPNFNPMAHGNFTDMLWKMNTGYYVEASTVAELLRAKGKAIDAGVGTVKEYLEDYIKQTVMDETFTRRNFLRLDVFFKDMSYVFVEQKESFTLISFFGEVGGFLGLLLGASVLTVCEVMDFVAMGIYTAYMKRKKIAASK